MVGIKLRVTSSDNLLSTLKEMSTVQLTGCRKVQIATILNITTYDSFQSCLLNQMTTEWMKLQLEQFI